MKRKHLKLIKKLNRLFLVTVAHQKGGELICEQDVMISETPPAGIQLRRPDMAFFTDEQINSENDELIAEFYIKVISPKYLLVIVCNYSNFL